MARFNLPDVTFIEANADSTESEIVAVFDELTGITLENADPRRKFIQSVVYLFTLYQNNVDYSIKQRMLAYANDDFLEHLGDEKRVERSEPQSSYTTIRFEVNAAENSILPAGTRLTVNNLYFATVADMSIVPGQTSVDIEAICNTPGTAGNGFLPGQIYELVDPQPWVKKAYNITTSTGGADWEDDDSYADRIRQSNEGFSTAGPEGAYEYFAKSANQLIVDVAIDNPSDGVVEIIPLLENGEIPPQSVLDEVQTVCSDKKVRPLTDHVLTTAPEAIEYEINVTYYVSSEKQSIISTVHQEVMSAVETYRIWQKSKLGRGIDPSELVGLMKAAGAGRITVTSPSSYQPLTRRQVAKDVAVNVVFGGVSND